MKKVKIAILFALFIILLLLCSKVNAASVILSPNKNSVTVGDEFTISMNLTGASLASLDVKIAIDTSKVEYVSSSSSDYTNFNNGKILYTWTDPRGGANPKTDGTIVTFRLRAKSEGTANFNISGKFYDANENLINMSLNGTSIKINANETEVNPPVNENVPPQNTNENNGENVEPPENNNTEIPPNEENNNEPPQENNNQESENNNSQLSSDAYLSSLQVDVEGISPRFNKNTTNYYLIVDDSVNEIKVNATAQDSNAKINITGNDNLKIGKNTIIITVTAQNGSTQKKYLINVTKTNDPNNANTNLENLAIENVILNPEFNADVLEYSIRVGSNIENLNILAVPEIEGAKVSITGGDKLSFGNNIVTITVTAKDGVSVKIYTVNVYRKTESEEIEEQNKLEENNNINENNQINELLNQNVDSKNKKNNVILWIIMVILLVAVVGIVIYIIWKNKMKKG